MSGNGDGKVLDLAEKFSIKELLERKATRREEHQEAAAAPERPDAAGLGREGMPPLDELSALPKPGDAYKAYSRPANQMLPTLHLLAADGQKWSFPYSCRVEGPHMLFLPEEPGKGAVLVMRFSASVPVEVVMAGIRLDDLHNYLGDHRIRWVRELPQGKPVIDPTIPVIRSIIVRPLLAEMKQGWPIVMGA
jgi:hypothetical protein